MLELAKSNACHDNCTPYFLWSCTEGAVLVEFISEPRQPLFPPKETHWIGPGSLPEEDWKCGMLRLLGCISVKMEEQDLRRTWRFRTDKPEAIGARVQSSAAVEPDLERTFHGLADKWRSETGALSSITMKSMHPAYQRIIGMGQQAVPLILRELQRRPDHWFWALTFITGEDPVPPEDAGDVEKMSEAWVHLGKQRGWL